MLQICDDLQKIEEENSEDAEEMSNSVKKDGKLKRYSSYSVSIS
jgi:hypothetical protein